MHRGTAGCRLVWMALTHTGRCGVLCCAGTFTKSFGSAGGYIAGSKQLVAYLRRHCPAHLYATSMAPGVMQQIISAIKLLQVRARPCSLIRGGQRAALRKCAMHCCCRCHTSVCQAHHRLCTHAQRVGAHAAHWVCAAVMSLVLPGWLLF